MTLVEFIVAMAIIILMITISFPKSSIEKYEVNSFLRQLCSDIRYVRKSNMLGDFSTYIHYTDTNGYILQSNKKSEKEVSLPKNARLENSHGGKIIFNINGAPQPKGGSTRVFYKNNMKEITVVPASGRVLLKEGKYE